MTTPPTEQAQAADREVHLRDYWKILWQARWMVIATVLVVVTITAVWTFMQTPIYRATATVEVQPQARNVTTGQDVSGIGAGGYGWFAEEKYHNTQVEIIRSRDVAERVIDRLNLRTHERFEAASDPVEAFRKGVVVVPRRDTGLIEISLVGSNPEEITHWVNEVAEAYIQRNIDRAREHTREAVRLLREQLDRMQDELRIAEEKRMEALAEGKLYNSDTQEEIVRQNLKAWHSELTEVRIHKNELQQTLLQIGEIQAEGSDILSIPELAKDETLRELFRSKFELERKLEAAKADLLPSHPTFLATINEIQTNDQRVMDRIRTTLTALQNEYTAAVNQERYLEEQISAAEMFSFRVGQATSQYEIVKTGAESQKKVFDLMSRAMNEVALSLQLMTNNVAMLDTASVPNIPISPRKRLNLMIGGVLGLFLGIAAAFFHDYLDNTFRTPEDIERYLGLAVLGIIPSIDDSDDGDRAMKEAYQSLRTSIIFSSKNRTRKVLLITSTGPQEGKSSTIANVGRALAQAGDRTIILDCDLRRPTQHLHHELEREPGITNFLVARDGEADLPSCIKGTATPGLDLLSCGPIPPSPSELLGSERFTEMIQLLRESYDWILIDSPPASSLADSAILASIADMVTIVIQHNKTDRDRVRKSLQRVRAAQAEVVGAVLNNVDIHRAYDKDYYYANYYYGAEKKPRKSRKGKVESKRNVG